MTEQDVQNMVTVGKSADWYEDPTHIRLRALTGDPIHSESMLSWKMA